MPSVSPDQSVMPEPTVGHVEVANARLYVEQAGEGEALTLLHGFLLDSGQWDGEFAAFAGSHRVLRYDARGFGRSSLPPSGFAFHEDLAALLDACGIARTALLACSGGAATALDFALAWPERVSALALVGPGYWGVVADRTPEARAFLQAMQGGDAAAIVETSLRAFTDGPRRAPQETDAAARARIEALSARQFARMDGHWRHAGLQRTPQPSALERLSTLRVPVHVIVGSEDQPEVHALAERLAREIPGARLEVVADAGHHANIEAPAAVMPLLRAAFGGH